MRSREGRGWRRIRPFVATAATVGATLAVTAGLASAAGGVGMVADITPGSAESLVGSLGGKVLFSAHFPSNTGDPVSEHQLWKSDGTDAGTRVIRQDFYVLGLYDPHTVTRIDGSLFFVADDGIHGRELWRSDGTAAGTQMVKDINPGSANGLDVCCPNHDYVDPYELMKVGGRIYFAADDGIHGLELWSTSGTSAGTKLVKDIVPGPGDPGLSRQNLGVRDNGKLVFFAGWSPGRYWITDGSAKTTKPLNGLPSCTLSPTKVAGSFLCADGGKLWTTDLTKAGTALLTQINPADEPIVNLSESSALHGSLLFAVSKQAPKPGTPVNELWISDGTSHGTKLVKGFSRGPQYLTRMGREVFFSASDGVHGQELWKTDGTVAGTVMVKDIAQGNGSYPIELTKVGTTLFFRATDAAHGEELWSTDGTRRGTQLVDDIKPGTADSQLHDLKSAQGELFFTANDGTHGPQLWKAAP